MTNINVKITYISLGEWLEYRILDVEINTLDDSNYRFLARSIFDIFVIIHEVGVETMEEYKKAC